MKNWLIKNSKFIFNQRGQFDPRGLNQFVSSSAQGLRALLLNQLQRKQQMEDFRKQLLLKQQIAQQDPQQQFLRQLFGQFAEGQLGQQPTVTQPTRYTPEEFRQLPLQQIQQVIPKTGFVPGQGLPFRPTTAPTTPFGRRAGAGQVLQPSFTLGPSGISVTGRLVEAPERKIKQQKLQLASGLRKEFNQAKAFKDFQTIDRSEKAMKQALEMSIKPDVKSRIASDQALGVLFQKMLDPASVVRESEYARTPEGAGLFNRITAFIPRLQKGGLALTNEDRQALYQIAEKLLMEAKRTMNAHIDRYSELADLYEVNPKMIFGNIKRFDISEGTLPSLPKQQFTPEEIEAEIRRRGLR